VNIQVVDAAGHSFNSHRSFFEKVQLLLDLIKFEHTVFALPFALASAAVAADGFPGWWKLGWILVAMVGARSAAMAFNRIVDVGYDAENPRTKDRALPRGLISKSAVWLVVILGAGLLVLAAGMLNGLALMLSPVALMVVLGYSYTKRFTSWSHIVLGMSLGIAPVGAWIGVRGVIESAPIVLAAAVILWTAGFDVIYSLQDLEFDRRAGLFSLPKGVGEWRALALSRLMHVVAIGFLVWFGLIVRMGAVYYAGIVVVSAFIGYEHSLVKPGDYSRVNTAFFTMNGFVSVGFLLFVVGDIAARLRL
jgi:4-hydroxybenzoate polyprenyltransferase